jgi:hypothetical protein
MIFFGSRGKTITGQLVDDIQCPTCENGQFVTFGVLRYFHLYWIPTFPTSKTVGIECTHCKTTLVDKELPEGLLKQIKSNIFTKKKTLPMFSGLIMITCLILFAAFAIQQENMEEVAYLEQPAVNDLYTVNFTKIFKDTDPEYKYGVIRVKHLSSEQAELQISNIAYNKTSGARKDIRKGETSSDSYYANESLYVDISKLKEMKESGAIFSVERI